MTGDEKGTDDGPGAMPGHGPPPDPELSRTVGVIGRIDCARETLDEGRECGRVAQSEIAVLGQATSGGEPLQYMTPYSQRIHYFDESTWTPA